MITTNESNKAQFDTFQEYCTWVRGKMIDQTIYLEMHINEYLANHFCDTDEKRVEIMDLLFGTNRITFDAKRQMLIILIKNNIKDFDSKFPLLNSELKKIMEERNVFAHYLLNSTIDGLTRYNERQIMSFIKFKGGRDIIEYNYEKVGGLFKRLDDVIDCLRQINQEAVNAVQN